MNGVSFGRHSFSDLNFGRSFCRATWTPRICTRHHGNIGHICGARVKLAEYKKSPALGSREDEPLTITAQGQEVVVVEEFIYPGSLIHSTTESSPDISRRNAITRAAMQNLDIQIWKSRISISTKLMLYNTCKLHSTHFRVRFWVLGSYQEGCIQDWCSRSMVSV